MSDEIIVAWKVGSDDSEVKLEHPGISENNESVLAEADCLDAPDIGLEMTEDDEEANKSLEIPEKQSVSRVNSAASYGSVGSFGSLGGDDIKDEKEGRLMRRRSKKASVCSNLSTFSISSEQPYMTLMSSVSRDRKLSSMSSDSSSDTRHSSFGSMKTRKISEGVPPFISMMGQNDSLPGHSCINENVRDQKWTAQNQIYGNGKKIHMKNFHGREKFKRRGEIFPGYEKTIQERANNAEDANEDGETVVNDEQKAPHKKVQPKDPGSRRGSLNPRTLAAKHIDQYQTGEGSESAPDLESQFARQGVRATVCSGQIKQRSKVTAVARSQSMRKPFQKIGDGFLKTLRQLKKK